MATEFEDLEELEGNGLSELEDFAITPEDLEGEDGSMEAGEFEDLEEYEDPEDLEYESYEEEDAFLPALAPLLAKVAPIALNVLGGLFGEEEDGEFGGSGEDSLDELAASEIPGLTALEDAEAEQLIAEAAMAESEAEAQALAGAATAKLVAKAPTKVKRVSGTIVKKQSKLTKVMRRTPATRKLMPAQNAITKKTVATLVRKAKKGKPVSKQTAARVVNKQAKRVLKSPKKVATAIRRNKVKRKRLSRTAIARAERLI